MFIIRIAILLGILAMFYPSTPEEKEKAIRGVSTTIEQVQTFCVRNGQLCQNFRDLTSAVGERLRVGVQLIYSAATGHPSDDHSTESRRRYREESRRRPEESRRREEMPRSTHTLRDDDLVPEWRGPGET